MTRHTYADGRVTLHHGDALDVLRELPDDSIDAVVTDPPYSLTFMGRDWDRHASPEEFQQWCQQWAIECLRVLKPGGHLLAFGGTRTYHRLAAGIEDAGFEIRDSIHWIYGCLSDDSEALTRRGWVPGPELRSDDEVMQWDGGALSWVRPERITVAPYTGPMVNLRNRHTDQLLTPNHRVYARVTRHSRDGGATEWSVTEAADLRPSWVVTLPMSGTLDDGKPVDPDYAYLVGWWLTDAWRHSDGKAAMFSQSKPETLARLRDALAPHQPSEYVKAGRLPQHADEHTFYVTGDLARQLIADHPDRRLTWNVLDWDAPARRALLDGLLDGDGTRPANGQHGVVFWSQNQERRDIVTALFLSLGWRVLEDAAKGALHANPRGTTQLQKRHRDAAPDVDYDGLVWCVTVPAGAFVARRNGHPFITGNSGFPKSLDVSKAIDKAAGAQREVVGVRWEANRKPGAKAAGILGEFGPDDGLLTAPATPAAAQWQGWGTALKPSHEPVIVARKPLTGTVAANVLQHGTGAINVDGTRVGSAPAFTDRRGGKSVGGLLNDTDGERVTSGGAGRWPSNVVFTHHPDCVQTGERRVRGGSGWSATDKAATSGYAGGDRAASGINHADADGTETVPAFDCAPGCPVNELDQQAPDVGNNGQSKFAAGSKFPGVYGDFTTDELPGRPKDKGGASRFFPVFRYEAKAAAEQRPMYWTHSCNCEDACPTATTAHARATAGATALDEWSTSKSGKPTTADVSPTVTTSTTSTATNSTTTPAISSPSPASSTNASTPAANSGAASGGNPATDAASSSLSEPSTGTCAATPRLANARSARSVVWSATSVCGSCGAPAKREAHSTVKPLDLMRWLVRLVTPPGGTVLDPFAGSGTTGEAALCEGVRAVLIEREADYLPLIRNRLTRRVDPAAYHRHTAPADAAPSLFDLLDEDGAA